MSRFDDFLAEQRKAVQEKKSTSHSVSAFHRLAEVYVNDVDYEKEIIAVKEGKPEKVVTKPVENYRRALAKEITKLGVPDEEAQKVMTMEFSKQHAASIADMGADLVEKQMDTGRRFTFAPSSTDETRMTIRKVEAPERISETRKIEKQEDGSSISVPTGKTVRTKKRIVVKASNAVLPWQKEDV